MVVSADNLRSVMDVIREYKLHFDGLVISGREGVVKPDPAIFDSALRETGLEAGEIAFVGDAPERFIVHARRVGFEAHPDTASPHLAAR